MSEYITIKRAELEQVLEAIEDLRGYRADIDEAITTLRESAQQAEPVEPVAWESWWLHHGQHNYRAKPFSPERVKELMKLAFEVGREAIPPQQAEPVAWVDALKDAFFEGFTSVATYNDTLLNSPEEAWANYKLPHIALAQQAEPVTIERLRDALVASRIIPPTAVEDPDGHDDGVTLFRIEALHRRLT